ncbi:MAG: metallophosphoesterase [Candidatus Omnitrophica bacterium]|nr:metallophosphoesterase [Candidatus Omnitrophota bacterium]
MKLLVISDTHIPLAAKNLPSIIENEAKTSDYCIHCGDFISYPIFEKLEAWSQIYAVHGNMDDEILKKTLPEIKILKLDSITLGITHGGGNPKNIISNVNNKFINNFQEIDIFLFGHSHLALNEAINGKIYFNPGSPTDTIFAPYQSYGIIEITGKDIKRRIVKFE